MKDGFGREITYARISITDLCNLRCLYCMPEGVVKKPHEAILSIEELGEVSEALAELGVKKQRLTGGEPLVRRGIEGLLTSIGGNPMVETLAITTNGQLLAEKAQSMRAAGVNAINISLDTLDEQKFAQLTKGGVLARTLEGLAAAKAQGFPKIKLNTVLLRGVNEGEIHSLAGFAAENGIELRCIELMPFACQLAYAKRYFIGTDEFVKTYGLKPEPQKTLDAKVSAYSFPDGTAVSFISPLSHKFCAECNRIRISADGKLLNCLHESREYDLRPYIGKRETLKEYITQCVAHKPKEHQLTEGVLQSRAMEKIGG